MASTSVVILVVLALALSPGYSTESNYAFARIESCSGCSLNRLPDVKLFIFEDAPQYDNVEFTHIQGAVPELVLLNENDEEMERIGLSRLSREECNNLLVSKGFTKSSKSHKDEM